jgi:hypothetical protein
MNEIQGEIIFISEIKTGQTKKGDDYKAIEYVVKETTGQYPQSLVLSMFNMAEKMDYVENFKKYNKVGDKIKVQYSTEASEYNGNYFGKNKPFKVERITSSEAKTNNEKQAVDSSDLPF